MKLQATNIPFHTFPRSSPLHGGEDFVVYPSKIKKGNISINLFSKGGEGQEQGIERQFMTYTNIPIRFSSDVIKYLAVISKV